MSNIKSGVSYCERTTNLRRLTRAGLAFVAILTLAPLAGPSTAAEGHAAQAPSTSPAFPSSFTPAEPQRAILYEDDPTKVTDGSRYVGSVVWRKEIKHDAGKQFDLACADVDIPGRKLKMTMSVSPVGQAAEFSFIVPADFSDGGGIFNVAGILMKPDELDLGTPLSGHTVKIADSHLRFDLSNADADRARNLMLLKQAPWFSIPIVYDNMHRAVVVFEKGKSGYEAFAAAFGP